MTFLVLLLTVAAYKVLGWHFKPAHDRWFLALCDSLERSLKNWPRLLVAFALLIPLSVVAAVLDITQDWLFGFAGVFLQVLILAYALGRVNLFEQQQAYLRHWRSGDLQSAYHHAEREFNLDLAFEADDRSSLHAQTCQGLLYQWFEQVFVIIFWYLLAGPLAALFVRLLCLYEKRSQRDGVSQLLHVLEWLPARLLVLTFAIAGNFTLCFKTWVSAIGDGKKPTAAVLYTAGLAAIGLGERQLQSSSATQQAGQLQTLQNLLVRSLVVWLMLVAVLTIF